MTLDKNVLQCEWPRVVVPFLVLTSASLVTQRSALQQLSSSNTLGLRLHLDGSSKGSSNDVHVFQDFENDLMNVAIVLSAFVPCALYSLPPHHSSGTYMLSFLLSFSLHLSYITLASKLHPSFSCTNSQVPNYYNIRFWTLNINNDVSRVFN